MERFKLVSKFKPCGDQPKAIQELTTGVLSDKKYQTLMGVTGSGKTFSLAWVIANSNKPVLLISHNKTLAAQLYSEFKEFFPYNAVEYFVSYYDYYQPEAYVPSTDTYIEKDSSINENLDKLRLSATSSLMSRGDTIVVASVSCIYNLGSPGDYRELVVFLERGRIVPRDEVLQTFVSIQYDRDDYEFTRGRFRAKGDTVEIFPAYRDNYLRIEFNGDMIENIMEVESVSGKAINNLDRVAIYPAKHFIASPERIESAMKSIDAELQEHLALLKGRGKLLEAQRLQSRTRYDMEMLKETGYCHGIENYSRHLSARPAGSRPYCLIDYFLRDFLLIIDESHVTVPQLHAMYEGDHARKETLVEYGFRLPSCLDNRPLKFEEFEELINQAIFVSATPAEYEVKLSENKVVEQVIRPTGIIDPQIIVRPTEGQIDNLAIQIRECAGRGERVLVTTLTKRMAEDLTAYLQGEGLRVKYLHSEVQTIERSRIIRDFRKGEFDCIVGINLLREGLDLPEVALVAILDADKEGFLRSQTSLIQVAGRAARNVNGTVIMYADTITDSMKRAISECDRRRKIQAEFNRANRITPQTIQKNIKEGIEGLEKSEQYVEGLTGLARDAYEMNVYISELEYEMELAARNLQFEKAAELRDKVKELKKTQK
ncbi:MAG: excinuclease ABC subunit UvrB [Candidatus Omnitrophota bacterium]|jgi:excinuclease ABC subunit B